MPIRKRALSPTPHVACPRFGIGSKEAPGFGRVLDGKASHFVAAGAVRVTASTLMRRGSLCHRNGALLPNGPLYHEQQRAGKKAFFWEFLGICPKDWLQRLAPA